MICAGNAPLFGVRGKTDKALSYCRLRGKEKAAPELVEIKESFRKQEPSMRSLLLIYGDVAGVVSAFVRSVGIGW